MDDVLMSNIRPGWGRGRLAEGWYANHPGGGWHGMCFSPTTAKATGTGLAPLLPNTAVCRAHPSRVVFSHK